MTNIDPLTFAELRFGNATRCKSWDPDDRITPLFFALELGGEIAEMGKVLNTLKKLERERLHLRGSRATLDDLAQELADVVIMADLVAIKYDLDLGRAIRQKFNHTAGLGEKLGCK